MIMGMPYAHYIFPSWDTDILGYYDSIDEVVHCNHPFMVHAALRQELDRCVFLVQKNSLLEAGLRYYAAQQPAVLMALEWSLLDNHDKKAPLPWRPDFSNVSTRFQDVTTLPFAQKLSSTYCSLQDFRQERCSDVRYSYLFSLLRLHLLEALTYPEIRDFFGGLPAQVQKLFLEYRWYHPRYQKESKATRLECLFWFCYYALTPPISIAECIEGWNRSGSYDSLYSLVFHTLKYPLQELDTHWFDTLDTVLSQVFDHVPLPDIYHLDPYLHPIHPSMLPCASFIMLTSHNKDMTGLFEKGILTWDAVIDELMQRKPILNHTEEERLCEWVRYVLNQSIGGDIKQRLRYLGLYYDIYQPMLFQGEGDQKIFDLHTRTGLPLIDCIDIINGVSKCDTLQESDVLFL